MPSITWVGLEGLDVALRGLQSENHKPYITGRQDGARREAYEFVEGRMVRSTNLF